MKKRSRKMSSAAREKAKSRMKHLTSLAKKIRSEKGISWKSALKKAGAEVRKTR